jgi:small neutral amino acid transporter SnatA (MarC family)
VHLEVLPLALTMMAGPQIISAVVLVTSRRPVTASLAFLCGVLAAILLGLTITRWLAGLLGRQVDLDGAGRSTAGKVIQLALVAVLLLLALKSYLGREHAEPPRWLAGLVEAEPRKALALGFLLVLLMPTDVTAMLSVGLSLERSGDDIADAWAFILVTMLIAAAPLLAYLLFRRRAETAMPKVRDWMNAHSWLINVIVCLLFAVLVLT